ncbi:MAG: NACHT domain-containing protein [Ardenticatenales bacterium]|nr:NACHT domain-containing protein [Ardenticatenales bacterium]
MGLELGDLGYSGAAVSDWERMKSKISAADRLVLLALLTVLVKNGGIQQPSEAEALLHAGDYRGLNSDELQSLFGIDPEASPSLTVQELPLRESPSTEPPELSRKRRRQLILLEKVRKFWIEGVLEVSMPAAGSLALRGVLVPEAVATAWAGVGVPAGPDPLELNATSLVGLFDEADRDLLILGAPGSGKTTVLLTLARSLIERAAHDPAAPIPLILQLSSWAVEQANLSDWVIAEMTTRYHIPAKIAREWLENDELLLLLDGFDRVPDEARPDCAHTINRFRQDYGFTSLAICSRRHEYIETGVQLDLGGAIELLPLEAEQVENYLVDAGQPYDDLRQALARNERVRALTQTPLLLNVLHSVHVHSQNGAELRSAVASEEQLLETYVDHMLNRQPQNGSSQPADRIRSWLAWLARNMVAHNQSQFLVELLQPSWLSTRKSRWVYLLLTRLWDGAVIGLVMWLLLQQYRVANPNIPTAPTEVISQFLHLSHPTTELVVLLAGNLGLSLLLAIINGIQFESQGEAITSGEVRYRQRGLQVFMVGVVIGFVTTAAMLPFGDPVLALAWGVIEGVVFMIFARYIHGRSFATEVRTLEALDWSWPSALKGIGFGLMAATFTEIIEYRYLEANGVWQTVLAYGFAGLLLGGLHGYRIDRNTRSNQGIWLSFYNAILAATVTAPLLGFLCLLIWGPRSGVLTTILVFVAALAMYGGSNLVKHLIIRGLLWLDIQLPLHLTQLLDETVELAFLRKVGGGYIFMHDLLLEQLSKTPE